MNKTLFSNLALLAIILAININAVGDEVDPETDALIARLMQEEYKKASKRYGAFDQSQIEQAIQLSLQDAQAGGGGGAAAATANPSGAAAAARAGSSSTDFTTQIHQGGEMDPVKYLAFCQKLQALDIDTRKQFLISGQYSATTLGFNDQAADEIYTAHFASLTAESGSDKAEEPYKYTEWDFNAFAKLSEYMYQTKQLTAINFRDSKSDAFSGEITKIVNFVTGQAYIYRAKTSDHRLKKLQEYKSVYDKFYTMAQSSKKEVERVLAEIFKDLF
ncbi:MAG: hypothetical protein CMM87_03990 [Rickettsiales bacterium]|nr:hypothetical protein [Rickettsiales bacterium]|tara:strand:- start:54152 stop:54976 length:825 start_codon:yes stop_codon:yes gene_type:complete